MIFFSSKIDCQVLLKSQVSSPSWFFHCFVTTLIPARSAAPLDERSGSRQEWVSTPWLHSYPLTRCRPVQPLPNTIAVLRTAKRLFCLGCREVREPTDWLPKTLKLEGTRRGMRNPQICLCCAFDWLCESLIKKDQLTTLKTILRLKVVEFF